MNGTPVKGWLPLTPSSRQGRRSEPPGCILLSVCALLEGVHNWRPGELSLASRGPRRSPTVPTSSPTQPYHGPGQAGWRCARALGLPCPALFPSGCISSCFGPPSPPPVPLTAALDAVPPRCPLPPTASPSPPAPPLPPAPPPPAAAATPPAPRKGGKGKNSPDVRLSASAQVHTDALNIINCAKCWRFFGGRAKTARASGTVVGVVAGKDKGGRNKKDL